MGVKIRLAFLYAYHFQFMKSVYPVFIQPHGSKYLVYIPDIDHYTEGSSFYEAIYMARDLLGTISLERKLPNPSNVEAARRTGTIVPVDIDTEDYRKKHDTRAVKKNCTIPSWLNDEAEAAGINFSRVLQDALIERLNLKESR